ncbi:uncharacterized protein LOC143377224 isoform X2 [Andrena cerasifolii]|uniref:uncharacterized protein LOC143377224 isoform X2 n=1 Tax=Andrena cerasifolii TaxID=2819439 RepID=UPI004037DB69
MLEHHHVARNLLKKFYNIFPAVYLTYQVDFDDYVDGCYIALFLRLPSSLYANINELNDLSRLGINTACAIGETDVELFTDKAASQNITICSSLIGTKTTLKLPIHQRYLYVNENSSHSPVTLQKPSLLLGCKKRIREHRTSKIDLCSPCVQLVSKWREIPYKDIEDIVWTIPVGNSSMVPVATYVTLLITILFTIFILQTIRKSIPKPNKKRQ